MTKISNKKLRDARTASGLSQSKAAAVMRTKTATLQSWEHDHYLPHPACVELFMLKTGQFTCKEVVLGNENYPTVLKLKIKGSEDIEVKLPMSVLNEIVKAMNP